MKCKKGLFVLGFLFSIATCACSHAMNFGEIRYVDKSGNVYLITHDDVTKKDHATYYGNTKEIETLIIPNYVKGVPVTEVELQNSSRYKHESIKKVVVGANIVSFSYRGYNWSNLITFDISKTSLTYIPYVVSGLSKLKTVVFNDCIKTLRSGCFRDCVSLELSSLPNSIETIEDYAFSYCHKISQNLKLPDNLKSLGAAFDHTPILGDDNDYNYAPTESIILKTNSNKDCLVLIGKDCVSNQNDFHIPGKIIGSYSMSYLNRYPSVFCDDYNNANIYFDEAEMICGDVGKAYSDYYSGSNLSISLMELKKVKTLSENALYHFAVSKISLPSTLTEMNHYCLPSNVGNITISDSNPYYYMHNYALYENRDNSIGIRYILQFGGPQFCIDDNTKYIDLLEEMGNQIDTVKVFTSSLEYMYEDIASNFRSFFTKSFEIEQSSTTPSTVHYSVENGSIIRNNVLILAPSNYRGVEEYYTPASASTIKSNSFCYIDFQDETFNLNISRNINTIEKEAILNCRDGLCIYIPKEVRNITGPINKNNMTYINVYVERGCDMSNWSNDWKSNLGSQNIHLNVDFDY